MTVGGDGRCLACEHDGENKGGGSNHACCSTHPEMEQHRGHSDNDSSGPNAQSGGSVTDRSPRLETSHPDRTSLEEADTSGYQPVARRVPVCHLACAQLITGGRIGVRKAHGGLAALAALAVAVVGV